MLLSHSAMYEQESKDAVHYMKWKKFI